MTTVTAVFFLPTERGICMRRMLTLLFMLCALSAHATNSIPVLFVTDDANPTNMQFLWQTDPGVRYRLETSTNLLSVWDPVVGYPVEATGLSLGHEFSVDKQCFFRIGALDEQPPRIAAQYPANGSVAIPRSADIVVEMDDPSGVDPSSLSLTVGAIGPVGIGTAGFGFVSNTITFDAGATPLGGWGDTISATIIAADPEGYTLTNTWSFRLETEPQAASNVFVFGSPSAQNMGQQVHGPAAALAAEYVEPSGPRIMNVTQTTWEISEVTSNSVVISYSGGSAPTFTSGQLICNLTPTSQDEIFYREVLGTADDITNSLLTLSTTDLGLTNFVTQGAISISADSAILELGTNGQVVAMGYVGGTLTFPAIGMNLSGSELALRHDGFEATVLGVTYSLGDDPKWLELTMPEWSWWFTPRIQAGLELDWGGMKSFQAIAQGDVSIAQVCDGTVVLVGVSAEARLFDIQGPWTIVYLGQLGPIPVFATLGVKMGLTAEAHANTQMEFGITYRQDHSASFGVDYDRATGMRWIRNFQSTEPDFHAEAALTEELGAKLVLDPRVEFLVHGLASMKAAVEPNVGIETTIPLAGGSWDGKAEAGVDLVLGTAGPAFDLIDYHEELAFNIWHGEWPLTPETLAFTTHPQSQTVAPGDAVSFSCTVDASSTPSFQWYHNGLPVPGQNSRSLFRSYVNTGHAGQYKVRATSGGLTEYSDSATLTVQATTPVNQDSDGDGIPDVYETNTGVWVSATDRGTSPNRWDSDSDGLSDGVETCTGVYVSRSNTGTNPNKVDTDGDGVYDKREIDLGTNPNLGPSSGDYLVVNLSSGPSASSYPVSYLSAVPSGGWTDEYKTTKLVLRRIPAGTFTMGSPVGELGRQSNETQHQVTLTQDFYIGVFEVTQKQWERVMGTWPSYFKNSSYRDSRPVEQVSYNAIRGSSAGAGWPANGNVDADSFMGRLRSRTGHAFDLPTESQWEYAGRAGATTALNSGYNLTSASSDARMNEVGRYWYNGGSEYSSGGNTSVGTAKVGSYLMNQWGLYDIHGNVWEWCLDWYGTYPGTVSDPRGATSGSSRVGRGGGWLNSAFFCRVAYRYDPNPSGTYNGVGFRACSPPGQQ